MRSNVRALIQFLRREDGPAAVEYAVLLALVVVICLTSITSLGTNANQTFTKVANTLSARS